MSEETGKTEDLGVPAPSSPSGCQPSVPNAKKNLRRFRATGPGREIKLTRRRSVSVTPLAGRGGKRHWGIILKNGGSETKFALSDEGMSAMMRLVAVSKALGDIPSKAFIMKRVEAEWQAMTPEEIAASGIEAATADETRSGSAEGESPPRNAGDAQ